MIVHQRLARGPGDGSVITTPQTSRTLGLKTLGFFVFRNGKMIETDKKKQQDLDWCRVAVLTPEQAQKLIEDKIARARQATKSNQKRETLLEGR
jgi:topoisomerase IA-like protein